jgi:hypothetical protein
MLKMQLLRHPERPRFVERVEASGACLSGSQREILRSA